jgi:hypothetical protein
MRQISEVLVRHPLVHFGFSVVFFTVFIALTRLLPGVEGIALALGPVVGMLAFFSSRARMDREQEETSVNG